MFRFWKIYTRFYESVLITDIEDLPLKDECMKFYRRTDCNLRDYDAFILFMSKHYVKDVSTKSFEDYVKNEFIGVSLDFSSEDEEIKNNKEIKHEKN